MATTDGLLRLAAAVEADSEHPWPGPSWPPPARTAGELPAAGDFRP